MKRILITGTAGFIGLHLVNANLWNLPTMIVRFFTVYGPWGRPDLVFFEFIDAIEDCLGKKAIRNCMQIQKGDVPATWANADLPQRLTSYKPQTDVRDGIAHFVDWYRGGYQK